MSDLDCATQGRTIPGPRSSALLNAQEQRESNARSYSRRFPFVVEHARGPYVHDVDGNVFLDFLGGAGSLPLGHSHPELVAVAKDQTERFLHGLDFATEVRNSFSEQLLARLPYSMRGRYKIHFCGPTGANAIDAAIKLAKTATQRTDVLSFRGGFHGTTHLGMALTGLLEMRVPVANTMPGVHFAPYSYCARCPLELHPQTCATNCVTSTETLLADSNGGTPPPAAVILEMVQGEGGVIPATPDFATRLARAASQAGAVLIVDEIQSGCGRTGTWFAFEQYGIEPDIICLSKSVSGIGTPVAVILYRNELDVWAPGAHTGTFRGNQMGFATGLKYMEIYDRDDIRSNVRARGQQLLRLLAPLADEASVADIRGRGLMIGIEFHKSSMTREVQRRALHRGLILEVGGRDDRVLRLLPPLNINPEECEAAARVILEAAADLRSLDLAGAVR